MEKMFILLFFFSFASVVKAEKNEREALVVIVSKDSELENISLINLRRIFLGEITYVQNKQVIPINLPTATFERITFDQLALEMSPQETGRYWIDRKIRGQGIAPKAISSAFLLQKVVAKYPEVISYVASSSLSDNVKVLTVDGKNYRQQGYALNFIRAQP